MCSEYNGFLVYSEGFTKHRIPTLKAASNLAKQHSRENPGLSVLLATDYRKYKEGWGVVSGSITLGFYLNGKRVKQWPQRLPSTVKHDA